MSKKILLILLCITTLQAKYTPEEPKDRNYLGSTHLGLADNFATYIGKAKFSNGQPPREDLRGTYTITNPGLYILTQDIISNVGGGQTVYINANNVTLDLNNFRIEHDSSSIGTNPHGITIAANLRNIIIENGTLSQIRGSGIYVNQAVTNLKIHNVTFNSCNDGNVASVGAITLAGSSGNEINNCTIDYCMTQSITPQSRDAHGLYATYTNYLTINNCETSGVRNIGKTYKGIGYYIANSQYPIITNSHAMLCEGDLIGSGFYLVTCTAAKLIKCQSHGNTSSPTYASSSVTTGTGCGFYLNDTNNSTLEDYKATNNSSGVTSAGFLFESCFNNYVQNCVATGQSVSSATLGMEAAGFRTVRDVTTPKGATKGCVFTQCTAFGQLGSTNPSSLAAGFLLGNSTRYCKLDRCNSSNNNGNGGTGVGIDLVSTCTDAMIQYCTIDNNRSTVAGKGIGIRDRSTLSSNLLLHNFAFANRDTTSSPTNNNYSVTYSIVNLINEGNSKNLAAIFASSIRNVSITPQI